MRQRQTAAISVGIFLSLMAATLYGCTRTLYLPTETVAHHIDSTLHISLQQQTDSVSERYAITLLIKDSVSPNVDSTGRITGFDRWHYEKESTHRSDIGISRNKSYTENHTTKRDSSTSITSVPVQNPVSRWDKWKEDLGCVLIGIILTLILIALRKIIKR